jgi:hypothetical protein
VARGVGAGSRVDGGPASERCPLGETVRH